MNKNEQKIFPIDVWGIKKYGINNWKNNISNHISAEEYSNIYNEILKAYTQAFCLDHKDREFYYLSVSNIKLVSQTARAIYDIINVQRIKQSGYTHLLSKEKIKIEIYDANIINKRVQYPYSIHQWRTLRLLKTKLLQIKNYIDVSKFGNENSYIVGLGSEISSFYCSEYNLKLSPIYTQKYIYRNKNRYKIDLLDNVDIFTKSINIIFPEIPNEFFKNLSIKIIDRLTKSYDLMMEYYYSFKNNNNKRLLILGIGSPLHCLIGSAWRLAGGKTIGFSHGNRYARIYNKDISVIDGLCLLNEFYASSYGEKCLISKSITDHNSELKLTKNISFAKNFYKNTFERLQKDKFSTSIIKKIMIIGCGQNENIFRDSPYHLPLSVLKLEYKIIEKLLNEGYQVIYKVHPDRIPENEGLFDKTLIKMVYDPFESIYHQADCVILPETGTTVFGFLLMTNMPMVIFNYHFEKIFPDVMELIKMRCRVVSTSVDEKDNIHFSGAELVEAINSSQYPLSHDVVNKYAL
jgi:hypothetical protein